MSSRIRIAKWHRAWRKAAPRAEASARCAASVALTKGGTLIEKLEGINDTECYYAYSLVEGPLPVSAYDATLRVRTTYEAPSCTVEWSGAFVPAAGVADAETLIRSIYQAGLDNSQQKRAC